LQQLIALRLLRSLLLFFLAVSTSKKTTENCVCSKFIFLRLLRSMIFFLVVQKRKEMETACSSLSSSAIFAACFFFQL
jgi:hypothetical protein